MRKRWCRRPGATRADFGTGSDPLSSLDSLPSSLPAGWPCTRATSRASSRLLNTVTFFRQDTIFGGAHQIMDFRQGLIFDGRLASGRGARRRATLNCFPWGFVRDRLLHHRQLESVDSASHPEIAIQPNPEVAHNTSAERRNYETLAFRNRRCNHF